MSDTERIQAVEALGFTARQARFVVTAALHSGYCVRRQYAMWAGIAQGRVTAEFFEKLVARRLAIRAAGPRNQGSWYHFSSPALYAALGDPHNRNRRAHPGSVIAQRLMILDFVLARRDAAFFPTEREKLRLFVDEYSVSFDVLPAKTYRATDPSVAPTVRYFVDKLPIFVSAASRVWVGYVLTERTADGFRTFLTQYLPLLDALPRAGVALITPSPHGAAAMCARVFDALIRDRVSQHFRARAAWEGGAYATFIPDRVRQLRADLRRFSSRAYQDLYQRWCQDGDATFGVAGTPGPDVLPAFDLFHAPYAYEHIGAFSDARQPVGGRVQR